jgi:L-alanine-DL-glutamate epimerase-like enolase superfamily enzyme
MSTAFLKTSGGRVFFKGTQSGKYIAVLSAIESALWNLAGKALGLPVYQLLGGKFRDKIRLYIDTALYQARLPKPEHFAECAREAVNTAVKFDLDIPPGMMRTTGLPAPANCSVCMTRSRQHVQR